MHDVQLFHVVDCTRVTKLYLNRRSDLLKTLRIRSFYERGLSRVDGTWGALLTHDLSLTEIAELEGLYGKNMHMQSKDEADPLKFDYILKPGVATQTNALAIARLAGVPV